MGSLRAGLYRHYKGNNYQVFAVVRHSETEEELVLYQPLYGESDTRDMWVRPLHMFLESVQIDGVEVPRFNFISALEE